MFVETAWYWFCICILFYNIFDLIESRKKVFYESDSKDLRNEVHISVCLKIDSKHYDCSNLNEESLSVCKEIKKYFKFIESESKRSPKEILEKSNELPTLFELENSFEKFKFLNLGNLCTLYKLNLSLEEVKNKSLPSVPIKLINIYHLSLKIFIHEKLIPRYQNYESLDCENFGSCHYFNLTLRLREIESLPYPSKTDCLDYSSEKFYFQRFENISLKSDCIQECIKYKQRLSDFFYTENDTDPLDFRSIGQNYDNLDLNRVKYCRDICSKAVCKDSCFIFESKKYNENQAYIQFEILTKINFFKTLPSIGLLAYWRIFFGYISLFFRVSILSLVLKSYKLLLKLRKKLAISIASIFLWTGFLACLFCVYYIGQRIYDDFTKKTCFTYMFFELPFSPINFSLALCKTVDYLIEYRNSSLSSLSKLWDPAEIFTNSEKFMVDFLNEKEELDISAQRFFYKNLNQSLDVCMSIDISVEEQRYRSLLSSTLLVKETTSFDDNKIYLHEYNKSFTTTSVELKKNSEIQVIEEHNAVNCTNYVSKYNGLCDSRQHCIDKCVMENFTKIFDKLPLGSLIYLDDYKDYQKTHLFFDFENTENDTFLNECKKEFNETDCDSVSFKAEEINEFSSKKNHLTINLFFNRLIKGSNLKFTLIGMIFVFFNLSTIVMGLNWPKLSRFIVYGLNYVCRLKPDESFNFR